MEMLTDSHVREWWTGRERESTIAEVPVAYHLQNLLEYKYGKGKTI